MNDHQHTYIPNYMSHTHSISIPIHTDSSVPSGTLIGVGGGITTNPLTRDTIKELLATQMAATHPKQKEPEVSTLEKVRREREEARERKRIEQMYGDYDEANLDDYESGTVLRFSWQPKDSDKTYEYAALWANKRWYVTGRESPNGLVTEDFVAWLIGKDVMVEDLIEMVPS